MKFFLLSLIISINSYALTLAKVDIKDKIIVQGIQLVLNGAGIRKATWLKVKVYVGSLYLNKKTNNITEVLNQKGPKFLRMHFVRDVGNEKLKKGWREAFKRSLNTEELKKYNSSINQFVESIQDMEKNDSIDLTFLENKLVYKIKNIQQKDINQKGFPDKLLSVWFVNEEDEGLKKGLLSL